jgi:hypothetical protein
MADTSRLIADGVWSIYLTRQGGKRLLDGEHTDSGEARKLFHNAIRDEPVSTLVELFNPRGERVDHSTGAYIGPHSTATH